MVWTPQAGPQLAFLKALESEVFFGGSAGGGKSESLLIWGLVPMQVPSGSAILFRESNPQLTELIDRAKALFLPFGCKWNGNDLRFTFPNGAHYEFGYGSSYEELYARYNGRQFDRIGFDELGNVAEERCVEFLTGRLRTTDHRLRPQFAGTGNPGGRGHAWLKRRYVDATSHGQRVSTVTVEGESITRRFIPAKLSDNPILLKNNPQYRARLLAMNERDRRLLLDGDWSAAEGAYFGELRADLHIVKPFDVPKHWKRWGGFDWGYRHPFAAGEFALSHTGDIYLVDSVHGRLKNDNEIAHRLKETLSFGALKDVLAGHDCWNKIEARGATAPSTADTFSAFGINLARASITRVPGWTNVRQYLTTRQADGSEGTPRFRLFDTPGNRHTFEVMQEAVTDPHDPEDVLKVDADPMSGFGGDDPLDMVRYGLGKYHYIPSAPLPDEVRDPGIRDQTVFHRSDDDSDFPGLPPGF